MFKRLPVLLALIVPILYKCKQRRLKKRQQATFTKWLDLLSF
jgi:hypothetical protein